MAAAARRGDAVFLREVPLGCDPLTRLQLAGLDAHGYVLRNLFVDQAEWRLVERRYRPELAAKLEAAEVGEA